MNDNNNTNCIENYTSLIEQISNLLNYTPEQIIEKYPEKEANEISWTKKNEDDKILEIRFEEDATISCEFNKKKICVAIDIFTDIDPNAEECAKLFNRKFKYGWFRKRWKTPSSYVYLRQLKDIVYIRCIKK